MPQTVAYYLSKGFDRPMAEYFAAGRKRLTAVQAGNDFTLLLEYEGGEKRLYDCKPFLMPDTVFAPLREPETFRRVYLDENHSVAWDIDPDVDSRIHWNNKIDLSPDTCYIESVPAEEK